MSVAIEVGARALRDRLTSLTRLPRIVAATLLGAVATLAMPPFHVVPAMALGLIGLLLLLEGAPRARDAFWLGWCFGFGHFVAGLYWFAHALLTDAEKFAWLIPLAISVIPACLAIYPGLAAALTWRFGGSGWRRVLVFAALWTIGEWFRGWVLTGLPWNLAGYVWASTDAMNQLASITGIFGISFLTVAALGMPAVLAGGARSWRAVVVAFGVLGFVWIGGWLRLPEGAAPAHENLRFRLVQPNIAQHHKWSEGLREQHLRRHVDLTLLPGWENVGHVVWPEAAIPYFLDEQPELAAWLGKVVPQNGVLFTGVPRITPGRQPPVELWNSIEAIDPKGQIVATYDKAHLVPFGEYLPFRPILGAFGMTKLAHGMLDFSSGPGPRTIALPGLPAFSPLVCYEAIFPGATVDVAASPPAWLLVVTNDAWFGMSTGPYQHFAMSRLRAVEQGLPMLRAANTGISAFVDPYGRVVRSLGLGEGGVIDDALPKAVADRTFFASRGNMPVLFFCLALVLFFAAEPFRQR